MAWLLAHGEGRRHAAGETIFEPGTPAEYIAAVLRGSMQFYAVKGGQRDDKLRALGKLSAGLAHELVLMDKKNR